MKTSDLYARAEADGVEVHTVALEENTSFAVDLGPAGCHIAMRKGLPENLERVALAHELGHCERGAFYNRWSKFDLRERCERKADKRAIELLVPKEDLEFAFAQGYCTFFALAEYFGVTEKFIRKAVFYYRGEDW